MSLSVETLAVARKYTDDSLAGAGAVAGVPCKIQSITAITGGNRVTFLWTDNNGDDHTSAMDVMNGVDGEDGKGIQSVSINAQNHLIITYTDGTTVDAGWIEIHSSVDSVNGQTGAVVLDAEDVGALPDNTPIPSKTSDLTNDSGFATTSDVSTALADYTKTADLTTLLAAKQDTLTFDNAPTENSNNPVKSGGVYAANQTLTNQSNSIVNVLGAKNLLPYPYDQTTKTVNGVTFTDNGDGSITLNGTNTAANTTFIFYAKDINKTDKLLSNFKKMNTSFKLIGGKDSPRIYYLIDFYDSSNTYISSATSRNNTPTVFTIPSNAEYITILIRCGENTTYSNFTVYPMLYLASITDDTYEPYAKTNQQLTEDTTSLLDNTEVNGAVNMLPNTATSQTIYGVTYTVNSDGSITVDGTATGGNASLVVNMTTYLKKGTYKLTGAPKGYENTTRLAINRGIPSNVFDNGNGAMFTLTEDATNALYVQAIVWEGKTVNNLTFKPMITVPSYNGDYVPYAKSNKELTEDVAVENTTISTSDTYIGTISRNAIYKVCGVKSFVLQAAIKAELTQGTTYTIGTLPDGYRPLYNNGYVKEVLCSSSGIRALIEINSASSLKITPRSGNISAQSTIVLAETFI